ncbi:MAG: hypothetical protein NVS3B24_04010 [Candidatus Dormibacteria bacterium]
MIGAVMLPVDSGHATGQPVITHVATIPNPSKGKAQGNSVAVIADAAARRIYVYSLQLATPHLRVLNADTYATLAELDYPAFTGGFNVAGYGGGYGGTDAIESAVGPKQIYFSYNNGISQAVVGIDKNTLKATTYSPWSNQPYYISGMYFDAARDKLYIQMFNVVTARGVLHAPSVLIDELDGETLASQWNKPYLIPECGVPLPGYYGETPAGRSATRAEVFTACMGVGINPIPVVLTIPLAACPPPGVDLCPTGSDLSTTGIYAADHYFFDAVADRLVIPGDNAGHAVVYVFDGHHRLVMGTIGVSQTSITLNDKNFLFDPPSGRLYVQSNENILVADTRGDTLQQGIPFPEFGRGWIPVPLPVDSVNHRFVGVPTHTSTGPNDPLNGSMQDIEVYQDGVPAQPLAPLSSTDAYTQNVPEKPGVTERQFSAGASAYGARVVNAGGLDHLTCSFLDGVPIFNRIVVDACVAKSPLTPGDRLLGVARLVDSQLTNVGFHANATGTIDESSSRNTDADLTKQGRPAFTTPLVVCSDLTPSPPDQAADNGLYSSAVHVACDAAKQSVISTGSAHQDGTGAGPSIHGSSFTSSITVPVPVGILSKTTATATGVQFDVSPGLTIAFGKVETTAEAWASGRPITEVTPLTGCKKVTCFARTISKLSISGSDVCSICDLTQVASAVALASTGRVQILFPNPDPAYADGTPGGYQSAQIKDGYQTRSDAVMNGDSSKEVPGMIVQVNNDSSGGRSRSRYEVAGVAADAQYGITQAAICLGPCNRPEGASATPGQCVASAPAELAATGAAVAAHGLPLAADSSCGGSGGGTSTSTSTISYPGASGGSPPPPAAAPSIPRRGLVVGLKQIIDKTLTGWSFLRRNPIQALMMLAVLVMLAAPLTLGYRRRQLTRMA